VSILLLYNVQTTKPGDPIIPDHVDSTIHNELFLYSFIKNMPMSSAMNYTGSCGAKQDKSARCPTALCRIQGQMYYSQNSMYRFKTVEGYLEYLRCNM
jgi:hypothetical protein